MEKSCRKCAPKLVPDPFLILVNNPKQPLKVIFILHAIAVILVQSVSAANGPFWQQNITQDRKSFKTHSKFFISDKIKRYLFLLFPKKCTNFEHDHAGPVLARISFTGFFLELQHYNKLFISKFIETYLLLIKIDYLYTVQVFILS